MPVSYTHLSIKPNLLVILIASIGFMEGSKAGMWTGFACGLLADLFAANGVSLISQNGATGDLLGFYALLFLYVGYLCGQANRLFYPEDIKLPLMMIADVYKRQLRGRIFTGYSG